MHKGGETVISAAFLFNEPEAAAADLRDPEKGNPGVGGTALCFAYILKYLENSKGLHIKCFSMQDTLLPCSDVVRVKDEEEAFCLALQSGTEIMILRGHQKKEVYDALKDSGLKFIFWMHNRLTYDEICLFRKEPSVKRVIAVGREMYDFYLDDPVIDKMDHIANPYLPPAEAEGFKLSGKKGICFIGALIPDKNFHILAAAWPVIKKEVPDVKLHVIGSGRLYDGNAKLGPFGLAEASYEESFMATLKAENGGIDKDVFFHGIMGTEKYNIFRECAVGVINPMGTETFGLAAVEMEAFGLPVVSRMKLGLPDAVRDKETGILISDPRELADALIRLLKDDAMRESCSANARAFASSAFRPEKSASEWERVISEVDKDQAAVFKKPEVNMSNNNKRVRFLFHGIRKIPLFKGIKSVHDIQKK